MSDTIRVQLKNTWFAPTNLSKINRIFSTSGRRYKPGIYTWPASVEKYLPKSAKVLGEEKPFVDQWGDEEEFDGFVEGGMTGLEDWDEDRAAAEAEGKIREAAEASQRKTPEEISAARSAHMRSLNERQAAIRQAKKDEAERAAQTETEGVDKEAPEAPAVGPLKLSTAQEETF